MPYKAFLVLEMMDCPYGQRRAEDSCHKGRFRSARHGASLKPGRELASCKACVDIAGPGQAGEERDNVGQGQERLRRGGWRLGLGAGVTTIDARYR